MVPSTGACSWRCDSCTPALHRDRAAERRQGINPDYDETELAALTGDAVAKLTVEETKFLGGDIDHTHLVRGLDFQLLNRVRENLNKQPSSKKRDEQPIKPLEAMPPPTALPPPRAAMPWAPAPKTTPTPKTAGHAPNAVAGPNFATPLGRRVYDAIFRPPRVEVSEHFLPRRTAFVYELDALDVPTTLRRSQADCPKVEERMLAVMHDQLLERIAKIMSHVGPSGKRRKKVQRLADAATGAADAPVAAPVAAQQEHGQGQARQQAEVPATMPAEEDVGDIFEDAGTEYVPTLPPKDALGDAPPASAKAGGVFATPAPRPVAAAAAPTLPDTKTLLREVEEGDEDGCVSVSWIDLQLGFLVGVVVSCIPSRVFLCIPSRVFCAYHLGRCWPSRALKRHPSWSCVVIITRPCMQGRGRGAGTPSG